MIQISYDYYTDEYLLGRNAIISADEFAYYVKKAVQTIKKYIVGLDYVRDGYTLELVKECACELAELLFDKAKNVQNTGVSSEKVGNYSVTYASATEQAESTNQNTYDIVSKHLLYTGLLYRGC